MKLIKFEKQNCPGCVMVGNYLKEQEIVHESIDAPSNPDLASKFRIMSTPVTILLDDKGHEVERCSGFNPARLDNMIDQL